MIERFCDQEDCPNFFYKEQKEKPSTATQIVQSRNYLSQLMSVYNTDSDIVNGNFPSDPRDGMKIEDVKIPVECFVCVYLKKFDMKTELKISTAINVLKGK